jgi:hypothetical protein
MTTPQSSQQTEAADQSAQPAQPTQSTQTTNQSTGPMNGVQANTISGGVDIDITMSNARPAKAELVTLWLTDGEIEDLKEQFVQPTQFDRAYNVLRDSRVVVLCGAYSGRTFTGRKLLLQHGHDRIAHLNGARSLATIDATELEKDAGYLWRASDVGDLAFPGNEMDQAAHIMRGMECRLVIIVDADSRVPHEACRDTVNLSPPNATEVARAVIRRQDEVIQGRALAIVDSDFAAALNEGDPPSKATRAADLAISVANGDLNAIAALDMLTENVDQAIATAYKDWSVLEFSTALAIAVLENKPLDEVSDHALRLDQLIRTAELAPDAKLSPRGVFAKSTDDLLQDVCARTDLRDHPRHSGLDEETVRFVRHDWAEAAVCHIWRQYRPVHPLLLEWMCSPELLDRFPSSCVDTLCLVTRIPAHDPLQMIDHLAAGNPLSHRKLASWTLVRLADVHNLQPVVDQTLDTWVDEGSPSRRATAAMTYALRFSKTDPRRALDRLQTIAGKTTSYRVRSTVVHSLLFMLKDAPEHRWIVLEALCSWASAVTKRDKKEDGPRQVALQVGLWVAGFTPNPEKMYVEAGVMINDHKADVAFLAEKVLWDREFGPTGLNRLFALANSAYYETPDRETQHSDPAAEPPATELIRILTLLTPDLHWWHRLPTVIRLSKRHPTRRKQIRWIFKVGRVHHHDPSNP